MGSNYIRQEVIFLYCVGQDKELFMKTIFLKQNDICNYKT